MSSVLRPIKQSILPMWLWLQKKDWWLQKNAKTIIIPVIAVRRRKTLICVAIIASLKIFTPKKTTMQAVKSVFLSNSCKKRVKCFFTRVPIIKNKNKNQWLKLIIPDHSFAICSLVITDGMVTTKKKTPIHNMNVSFHKEFSRSELEINLVRQYIIKNSKSTNVNQYPSLYSLYKLSIILWLNILQCTRKNIKVETI